MDNVPRAMDFYLAVGCEVHLVADGWVQFRQAETRFVLVQGCDDRDHVSELLDLTSPDLLGLRGRVLALGIEAGPIVCSPSAPDGRIQLQDPDLHTVMITCVTLASAVEMTPPVQRGPRDFTGYR
ncbi:hypothetical protein [Umezawaea sp. NPDC059074]|uniref:hypothetical protein n=1 Tax=Umezawaea sp. NPDC059074 TaxID=3346716 RepID=UPI0036AEF73B